jgi:hypothetical protein
VVYGSFDEDPVDLDVLRKRLTAVIRFDTRLMDANSRVGYMLDELMKALEQDHQEWVLYLEGKVVVDIMTKAIKPTAQRDAGQKQMALQRNKPLKTDVFRFVKWPRTYAAGCQMYLGLDEDVKLPVPPNPPKPAANPKGGSEGKPGGGGAKPDAPKPKTGEKPRAKLGCLKCGSTEHRVADCPDVKPGEAERLQAPVDAARCCPRRRCAHQQCVARLWRGCECRFEGRYGCTRASERCDGRQRRIYPNGKGAKPLEMTRHVRFGAVTLITTCGPLVLRRLQAWIDDTASSVKLIVRRPVMEILGFSTDDLLDEAHSKNAEWDVSRAADEAVTVLTRVQILMSERLDPPDVADLDPDDGLECAMPVVELPPISVKYF